MAILEEQGDPNVPCTEDNTCQNPCCVFNIKVLAQDSSVCQFRIRKITPLMKLIKSYCDKLGLTLARWRFLFDGHVIREPDTALSIGMNDGDVIEVFRQMN